MAGEASKKLRWVGVKDHRAIAEQALGAADWGRAAGTFRGGQQVPHMYSGRGHGRSLCVGRASAAPACECRQPGASTVLSQSAEGAGLSARCPPLRRAQQGALVSALGRCPLESSETSQLLTRQVSIHPQNSGGLCSAPLCLFCAGARQRLARILPQSRPSRRAPNGPQVLTCCSCKTFAAAF